MKKSKTKFIDLAHKSKLNNLKYKNISIHKFKITTIYKVIIYYTTFILCLFISNITVYAMNTFSINVANTTAGYSTVIQTTPINPGTNINFIISKPDGTSEYINAISNSDGIATATIYGNYLYRSGLYTVTANAKGYKLDKPATFEVQPSNMAIYNSKILASKQTVVSDGIDKSIISVILKDEYNNPIPNHKIILISQDKNINITPLFETTDENGIWQASISSTLAVNTDIEAVDITTNKTLAQKINISFVKTNQQNNNAYSNKIYNYNDSLSKYLTADVSNVATSNIKLILDGPSTTEINKDFTIRVRVVDEQNKILSTYNGSITFSSSDPQASLPSDFTFTEKDKGTRTFSLSARLKTPGIQTINVFDKNNKSIQSGNLKVEVVQNGRSNNEKPIILEPINNTITNSKTINIKGYSSSGSKISYGELLILYDNNAIAKEFQSDTDGAFNVSIDNLTEGQHILKVVKKTDTTDIESDSITIYADFTAPAYFGDIILSAKDGYPGDIINIKVISEPELLNGKIFINNQTYELLADGPPNNNKQAYTADIQLPINIGEYSIDLELVDKAGNNNLSENVGKITVYPRTTQTPPILPINSDYLFKCKSLFIYFPPIQNAKYYKIFSNTDQNINETTGGIDLHQEVGDAHVQYEMKNINLSNPLYIKIIAYDANNQKIASDNYQIIDYPDKHVICEDDNKGQEYESLPTGPHTYLIIVIALTISIFVNLIVLKK